MLYPEGVEVTFRDTTVWCPWALFNVDGKAFVPDVDSPRVGLTLPIAPQALPFVDLRRDDTPIAHGAGGEGASVALPRAPIALYCRRATR